MSTLNSPTEAEAAQAAPFGAQMTPSRTAAKSKLQRAPLHPGEVIADILDDARLSGREVSSAIGMSPNGFNKVLTGESPVTPATALRLGVYFGNGPELWLDLQRAYDLHHVGQELKGELAKIVPVKGVTLP